MVAQRRFAPLIVLVVCGLGLVGLRMLQVQVGEHAIWAREAANLVRSHRTLPYERGPILDRRRRLVVQDDENYRIELTYRTFRREHPLGQVAHARSALEMRPVSLHYAADHLVDLALELAALTPRQVAAFERGQEIVLASGLSVPAADPRADRRSSRAGELGFYLPGILGLSRAEWSRVKKRAHKGGADRSWLELAAAVRGVRADELELVLAGRLVGALADLEQLARLLGAGDGSGDGSLAPWRAGAGERAYLIELLQRAREGVDDAIASELFRQAAGFSPGRIARDVLRSTFDLDWIARTLRWSDERTQLWIAGLREAWEDDHYALFVPGAFIRADSAEGLGHPAGRVLDELAALYAVPPRSARERRERVHDWRRTDRLIVLDELATLFDLPAGTAPAGAPALPFERRELRERAAFGEDPWSLLAAMVLPVPAAYAAERANAAEGERPWVPPAGTDELAARMRALLDGSQVVEESERADGHETPAWFARGWEGRFQEVVAERLEQIVLAARECGRPVPLELSAARRERALEQASYVVRDRGSRAFEIDEHPAYDLVHLLTRYSERYGGFRVRTITRRVAVALEDSGRRVAPELIGSVREPSLEEVVSQRHGRRALFELSHQTARSDEDLRELRGLVAQLYRNDELHGTSGIEGLFDEDLRGENGYSESEGLEERAARGRDAFYKPPRNGSEVVLTLDLDLQRAAQRTLEHPLLPPAEQDRDVVWFANPVGAICLITPEGEVLAAASVPSEPDLPAPPGRDGQRAFAHERTLRMHTFQPLGSVFKPFVAAWALDHLALDPDEQLDCAVPADGRQAAYGAVRCHRTYGHGPLALREALEQSCNAYFAWLGERYGTKQALLEMSETFGFDRPTGVKAHGGSGLVEDWRMRAFERYASFPRAQLQRAGNGLAVIEGTPLQVARAMAALATGRLPELRLVRSAGGRELPAVSEPLPISAPALELVRAALAAVVETGTAANRGLGRADLGFRLAAKTGSADYYAMNEQVARGLLSPRDRPERRKHTWLAGWFPARDPVAIVVVFLHDVGFTSGHTAVHVASQFLRSAEVRALVEGGTR